MGTVPVAQRRARADKARFDWTRVCCFSSAAAIPIAELSVHETDEAPGVAKCASVLTGKRNPRTKPLTCSRRMETGASTRDLQHRTSNGRNLCSCQVAIHWPGIEATTVNVQ